MVNREVVGAHYGLRDWLAQRVTAVVMAVYTVLLAVVASQPQLDYEHWKTLWALPLMRYSTVLCLLSLLVHAWVGVRNIFMDYIKSTGLRLILYVIVILALVGYGVWSVQILWGS